MNQDTKNKFAEILAAAQAKANVAQAKTTINAVIERMNAENEAQRIQLEKIINSDTQGILNDTPKATENKYLSFDELSTLTIGDLLGEDTEAIGLSTYEIVKYEQERETPVYCNPCTLELPTPQQAKDVFLVDYNEYSFALIGEGTRAIKDKIQEIGGKFNPHLKCGKGWIFSKKHLDTVKASFNL